MSTNYADSKGSVAKMIAQAEEITECARFPLKQDTSIDLYQVERILRLNIGTADRVKILSRLVEAGGRRW